MVHALAAVHRLPPIMALVLLTLLAPVSGLFPGSGRSPLPDSFTSVSPLTVSLPETPLRMRGATDGDGTRAAGAPELYASWIPARPSRAITGSAFAARTAEMNEADREQAALDELRNGNLPEFLRHLKEVHLDYRAGDGAIVTASIWVMPDYLSIGSDDDFLRIPLDRNTAVRIGRELGFVLPTPKIVDAVNDQADFHFRPQPLPPGKLMRSIQYFLRHNRLIEEQHRGHPRTDLVSGHKKDVVLTNRLVGRERVAIYGWHRKDGHPIQSLSTVHGAGYADYSHGVRLVYEKVRINGQVRSIYDVLQDPSLAPALTYEGLIPRIRRLMQS